MQRSFLYIKTISVSLFFVFHLFFTSFVYAASCSDADRRTLALICAIKKCMECNMPSTATSCCNAITESQTISQSGSYCLANSLNGYLIINADDVVIDMNGFEISNTADLITVNSNCKNIEIKNGTLNTATNGVLVNSGASLVRLENLSMYDCQNGVNFAGASGAEIKACSVEGCLISECTTGVLATYLIKSTFKETEIKNGTQYGFKLENSSLNKFIECSVEEIENSSVSQDTIAFASSSGSGNIFKECLVNGIEKTASDEDVTLAGFDLCYETDSQIFESVVNKVSGIGSGNVYGIHLCSTVGLSVLENATFDNELERVNSVDWDSTGSYLAIGTSSPAKGDAEARVLRFDGTTLSEMPTATFNHGEDIVGVGFDPTNSHLAIGGQVAADGAEVRVLSFASETLSAIPTATFFNGARIRTLGWHPSGDYFAVGSSTNSIDSSELRVLGFDGTTLSSVATFTHGNTIWSVDFDSTGSYLAVGGHNSTIDGAEVRVLAFDSTTETLSEIPSATFDHGDTSWYVNWHPSGDYLAIGANNSLIDGADVRILSFNGSTLTELTTFDHGNRIESLAWNLAGDRLVIGGRSGNGGAHMRVLKFTGSTLSEITTATFDHGNTILELSWDATGSYIAIGGESSSIDNADARVLLYQEENLSTNCFVDSNKVCNVTGENSQGIGISANGSQNVIMRNVGYDSDTNFGALITNVYSGGVSGKSKNLENISIPPYLTNIDTIEDIIESKIDILIDNLTCAIKGTTTISSPGYYCLANNISGRIIIDSDDVVLDLNNFQISGAGRLIEVNSGKDNVQIINGTIKGDRSQFDSYGVYFNGNSSRVYLKDLRICDVGSGIYFNYPGEYLDCSVENCTIIDATNVGVYTYKMKNSTFDNVCVKDVTNRQGFLLVLGENLCFYQCKVSGVTNANFVEGIRANGCTKLVFKECCIMNVKSTANDAYGFSIDSSDSKIIDSIVMGVNADKNAHGIILNEPYSNKLVGGNTVERNNISNIFGSNISRGISINYNSNIVSNNIIHDLDKSNGVGIYLYSLKTNNVIDSNQVYDCGSIGINNVSNQNENMITRNTAYNNTINYDNISKLYNGRTGAPIYNEYDNVYFD